jgi:hypothetical protein
MLNRQQCRIHAVKNEPPLLGGQARLLHRRRGKET